MRHTLKLLVVAAALLTAPAFADNNPMVGNTAMMANQDIVTNALKSPVHTTLVAALKAAGLVETLQGKGPFTVFAPTNDAFRDLPAGTVDTLLKPENKATLVKVLTYHVLAGKFDAAAVKAAIKKGGGKAVVKTVAGENLTLTTNGPNNIVIKDAKGNTANIVTYDVLQSNGVIHVIDTVLLPN